MGLPVSFLILNVSFTFEEFIRHVIWSYDNKKPNHHYFQISAQCIWAYFGCGAKHNEKVCKQRFDNCMSGQSCKYFDDTRSVFYEKQ